MNPVIQATKAERDAKLAEMRNLCDPERLKRRGNPNLTTDERARFEGLEIEIRRFDRRIVAMEALEKRTLDDGGLDFDGSISVRQSPLTYDPMGANSYLRDIARIAASGVDQECAAKAPGARERLAQHAREVEVVARTDKRVAQQLRGVKDDMARRGAVTDFERRINPNTTAGFGGELVPPLWDEKMWAAYLRPTRTFANRVTNLPLPPGVDVVNIPKITLGGLTAPQAVNAAAIASRDILTTVASSPVITISGQEDISMQLLEQSPLAFDNIVYDDLNRDYDQQLDSQLVSGAGTSGQHTGLLNLPQVATPLVNSVDASAITVASSVFFDGSTSGSQFRSIVKGVTQIETLTFSTAPPTAIWCHPRRANSWAYAADSGTGRPLYVRSGYGPINAVGVQNAANVPEGVSGFLFGLPVVQDSNMPTTMNATATTGGTADPVIILNEEVPLLYEGTLRFRALPEVLSGTLQIRYQLYGYSAWLPNRWPTSVALLTGNSGLAAPGF